MRSPVSAIMRKRSAILLTHFVVSHVGLGPVQQSLEFQSICVSVRYDVAHLADDSGEDEHANEVTNYGEHVPGHKRGEYKEGVPLVKRLRVLSLCGHNYLHYYYYYYKC